LRRRAAAKINKLLIDITPTPALRRIIAFDDRMSGGVEMLGCVPVR
jgi:hypothetical protein